MVLVVRRSEERAERWIGAPARGLVTIGSAIEADVAISGHNIAGVHVRLRFGGAHGARLEVRKPYGVRLDGRCPRPSNHAVLTTGGRLEIGPWTIALDPAPRSGIEPVDEAFLAVIARDVNDAGSRLVYADSLEDRGRVAEAEIVRGASPAEIVRLAAFAPPAWRRRWLPVAIERCARRDGCPGTFAALADDGDPDSRPCATCARRVGVFGNLGAAREHALTGAPVAIDPAVRRWPRDLEKPVVRQPAIVMGRPA